MKGKLHVTYHIEADIEFEMDDAKAFQAGDKAFIDSMGMSEHDVRCDGAITLLSDEFEKQIRDAVCAEGNVSLRLYQNAADLVPDEEGICGDPT